MRLLPIVATLLALSPTVLSQAAVAQVTTNDRALDSLKAAPAPETKAADRETHEATHRHRTTASYRTHTAAAPAKPAQKLPQVPPAPPPNPVIAPPPLVLPTHPPPPPPPVPLRADAPGQVAPLPDGARITFGPGSATLNPTTFSALLAIATAAKSDPAMTIGITAWAPGTADDPSTPRRLSLDRVLAARAVLIANGVVSERIRPIAKGMTDLGSAPPDRADIIKILPPPQKK